MPLLIMHAGKPPVAVANKTPVARTVVPPQAQGGDDVLYVILNKLKNIEAELGIVTPPVTEADENKRTELLRRLELANKARAERAMEADAKKQEFLKRMKKGKQKAARKRGDQ